MDFLKIGFSLFNIFENILATSFEFLAFNFTIKVYLDLRSTIVPIADF
ncbi:MAG: hypothetical protein ACI9JT_001575 [Polaribacter sp.]|jgi:hypothetical protein